MVDKQHGIGNQINLKNECYEGEFVEGLRQERGKLDLNQDEEYEGEFQNGTMNGEVKERKYGKMLNHTQDNGEMD